MVNITISGLKRINLLILFIILKPAKRSKEKGRGRGKGEERERERGRFRTVYVRDAISKLRRHMAPQQLFTNDLSGYLPTHI
jgi:hypothetical protein